MTNHSIEPADAFISYKHASVDLEAANHLGTELSDWHKNKNQDKPRYKWNVFLDHEMRSGADWKANIREKIQGADCFIALISRSSLDSEKCRDEWSIAEQCHRQRGRPHLLPLRLDDSSEIPEVFNVPHIRRLNPLAKRAESIKLHGDIEDACRAKQKHDFWGDAFYERELQLVVAKRSLISGRFKVEDVRDAPENAQPEGVAHWLAMQDIRAAVHLTNELARIRRNGIQVVHSDAVNLNEGRHCAIALGLGFNCLTRLLERQFKEQPLFTVGWGPSERSGVQIETDRFALAGEELTQLPDESDRALLARIVLPAQASSGYCAYFICAGRTAPGTDAAGRFLAKQWQDLLRLYQNRGLRLTRDSVATVMWHPEGANAAHEAPAWIGEPCQYVARRVKGFVD